MRREYIPISVERRVREAAQFRCGYCLSPQHLVMARLEIEHLIAVSRGGSSDESNLWPSCPLCNKAKSDRPFATAPATGQEVPIFNPRTQLWHEHFGWSSDGLRILGKSPIGRATVALLNLDSDPDAILVRS
ncbi:MAG: HNH endonuclease [Gemmataceae bacterium]|nr:HNH endonuclease [Gemmataceae bacterium]